MATFRFSSSSPVSERALDAAVKDLEQESRERPNGQLTDICARILAFESLYEMSSGTMQALYREGRLKETRDICTWLMLLEFRNDAMAAAE